MALFPTFAVLPDMGDASWIAPHRAIVEWVGVERDDVAVEAFDQLA